MKQLLFMVLVTALGTVGAVGVDPFLGIAAYYTLAVLRPQYLWRWALPTGVSWSFYIAVATIAGTALWLLGTRDRLGEDNANTSVRKWPFSRAHGSVLLFGLWVPVSYMFAVEKSAAFNWVIEYIKIFVMFGVAAVIARNLRQVWLLYVLIAVSLGYIAYEVNIQYFFDGRLDIYREGYGGLDNNGAALMLAMGIPLCVFAWEGTPGRLRWLFAGLIPILFHAVLMTYSRGAMSSLLLISPLIIFRARNRKIMMLGALGIVLAIPWLAGNEIRSRFMSTANYKDDMSAQSRFQSWGAGLQIALDNPIVGVGPRNADLLSHKYGADIQGRAIHSQYLQTAADLGFVGLALYLNALLAGLRSAQACYRRAAQLPDALRFQVRAAARGIEIALALFAVGSAFLSLEVFELPYLLLLLGCQLPKICEDLLVEHATARAPLTDAMSNGITGMYIPVQGTSRSATI